MNIACIESTCFQAETEVASLHRKLQLLEEELERTRSNLNTTSDRLNEISKAADESDRSVMFLAVSF